jgi:hypothetical protein
MAPVPSQVRIFSKNLVPRMTLATVFSTGKGPVTAAISLKNKTLTLTVRNRGTTHSIPLPFSQEPVQ